jgi:hypothetical protein
MNEANQISNEHRQLLMRLRNDIKRALAKAEEATNTTPLEAKAEEVGRELEAATASFNKGNLDNLERMGSLQYQLQMLREKIEEKTDQAGEPLKDLNSAMCRAAAAYRDVLAATFVKPLYDEAFQVLSPLYFHTGHGRMEASSMPVCMSATNFMANLAIYSDISFDRLVHAPALIALLDGVIAGKNPFYSLHAVIRGEKAPGEAVPGLNLPNLHFLNKVRNTQWRNCMNYLMLPALISKLSKRATIRA